MCSLYLIKHVLHFNTAAMVRDF